MAGAVSSEEHDEFVQVTVDDVRARPLLDELTFEYSSRYGDVIPAEEIAEEMRRYPAADFEPPRGAFILLLRNGEAIAGGAFMPHEDPGTVEFKRIWASRAHRRQGLAKRVLAELEAIALRQGHTRVYLGTGPRQPEAVALYKSNGYTLLSAHDFGEDQPPGVRFEKRLPAVLTPELSAAGAV